MGVCRVENRSTRLRFEEAVHIERQREGEGQAGQLDYEFLVWKEGISLDDVVARGKFPQQVRDVMQYTHASSCWYWLLAPPPLPRPAGTRWCVVDKLRDYGHKECDK